MTSQKNSAESQKYDQLERYLKRQLDDIIKSAEILRKRVITLENRVKELEGKL